MVKNSLIIVSHMLTIKYLAIIISHIMRTECSHMSIICSHTLIVHDLRSIIWSHTVIIHSHILLFLSLNTSSKKYYCA